MSIVHDTRILDAAPAENASEDRELFRRYFERYAPAVHRYAVLRVGNDAAEDVVAETFATAWRNRERYDAHRASVRTWLLGITTTIVRRHLSDEASQRTAIEALSRADHSGPPLSLEDAVGQVTDLVAALATLSPSEREILVLSAVADLKDSEVAKALGISSVAARVRLHRARRKAQRAITRGKAQ